jgi:SAM-dependent methyltransferase
LDLRGLLPKADIERAASILRYQPYILTDDLQTGAGYSWFCAGDPRVSPQEIFRKSECTPEVWERAVEANGRVRAMYDDMLDEVAGRFSGGSLLDLACNSGYFPVGAERRGMRGTGMDVWDFSAGVSLLNDALGTKARFVHAGYDPVNHRLPELGEFDVTVISAIMCHLPDPVYFLTAVARVTKGALLFWGQMIDSDLLLISYLPPFPSLPGLREYPHLFNDNTRISRGLFDLTVKTLGFREVIEIRPRDHGWKDPRGRDIPLAQELGEGSRHPLLLALR